MATLFALSFSLGASEASEPAVEDLTVDWIPNVSGELGFVEVKLRGRDLSREDVAVEFGSPGDFRSLTIDVTTADSAVVICKEDATGATPRRSDTILRVVHTTTGQVLHRMDGAWHGDGLHDPWVWRAAEAWRWVRFEPLNGAEEAKRREKLYSYKSDVLRMTISELLEEQKKQLDAARTAIVQNRINYVWNDPYRYDELTGLPILQGSNPVVRAPDVPAPDLLSEATGSPRVDVGIGPSRYAFVRIPTSPENKIGLTTDQRDDPVLLERQLADPSYSITAKGPITVPLRRSYFIQETEVTQAQYLEYLRATGNRDDAPPQLQRALDGGSEAQSPDLPITDINFHAARRFAEWVDVLLQKQTADWHVRLPHEIEWEIAARHDSRRWSFDGEWQTDFARGPAPKPVKSEVRDRGLLHVYDMSANVSEWTASAYHPKFILQLGSLLTAGYPGWDPAHPYKGLEAVLSDLDGAPETESYRICTRGGANGEEPSLLQLSVRRAREWSDADDRLGFRLVIVPVDSP